MKKLMVMLSLIFILLIGCQGSNEITGFTSWDEEKVYSYLNEVLEHTYSINTKTYNSKEEIVNKYNKYFSNELSMKIVDSLFIETTEGWKVPDGDSGYIFSVPQENDNSETRLDFQKDSIRISRIYEIGMFSSISYVIENYETPMITEWKVD